MMMPANFSAVNAEVVYGGAVADYLPNAWTAASVKQFSTNVITLVSNTFTQDLINTTLGVMFSGNWGEDNKIFGDDGALKNWLYGDDMNFGNKIMRTLGAASVIYTLGMKDAAVLTAKKVTNSNGGFPLPAPPNLLRFYQRAIERTANRKIRRPFSLRDCYQTETFFTFFSKIKGLLKIVLLNKPTECVILCPRFRR